MTTPHQTRRHFFPPFLSFLVLACSLSLARPIPAVPSVLYVSTRGNDGWSGTRSTPNFAKSDGPFKTLPRAIAAVREQRRANGAPGAVRTIYIAGGVYELSEPLVLQPQDSGLTIAALSKDKPVLSGGRLIQGWRETQRQGKTLWTAEIPQVRDGHWYFRELWVNDRRAVRARHPNQGYLKVSNLPDSAKDWTRGQTRFEFAAGDLQPWNTLTQAEVIVMNRWADSRLPVTALHADQRVIEFSKRSVFALEKDDLYYLEGAFEALDQPGEWFLDRLAGLLYYLPRPGESLNKVQAIAPVLTQVLRFEGRPEQEQFIEHVMMRGLIFSHTEWCFPDGFSTSKDKPEIYPAPESEVGGFGQAEVGVPGAVWGNGVRNCVFENCSFRNLGDYGLELARGCQSNKIQQCEFSQLGAGGIKLGETAIRTRPSEQTGANEVVNCQIHDGGQMFHSAIGIWIGQSPDNRLLHNVIHDFYYTGISIGWTWGYGAALASSNLVAFNHIHHIGVKSNGDGPILSDMGGIYTLGKQPGTKVLNNLWHDIAGLRYGGWGIYFDEGSSGILASSNVVYRTTHGGFHQHYGETNLVQNNIFAFGRDQQLQRTRVEPHMSFSFETNIVYFENGSLLSGDWSKDQYQMDWNVYFDKRLAGNPGQIHFANVPLDQWRARGHDLHSDLADPLFVAPEKYDFRLRPESPAIQLGFKPIDLSHVGP
ncbi:MAG TPA: right-handed parallel beta-helix repeat-containing protein [Verrucomicrobiae bacterium]|nr:right-handed parallel beta-helix repeat-containing protein [Verrucomicrobiae bacterium]